MPTIGEAISSLECRFFTGRETELDTFKRWLTSTTAMPEILNVTGRGGIGKSSLLRAFVRIADGLGKPHLFVDSRDFPHTPEGFLSALQELDEHTTFKRLNETCPLILIDTFEELGELNRYVQEEFLPRLDTSVKVVIAGRYPLGLEWTMDSPWHRIVRSMPLDGFSRENSQAYLRQRGINDQELIEQVVGAVGGNPLALSLAADMIIQFDIRNFENAASWRLILRTLVERLLSDVKEPQLRELLDACAVVRQFDEATLAAVSRQENIGAAFDKLCRLSVVRPTENGLMLHDDIRRALADDLRWRRPDHFNALRMRALAHYRERMRSASLQERQRLLKDRVFLLENAVIQATLYSEDEPGQVWIEAGRPADYDDIRRIWAYVREHLLSPEFGFESQPQGDWEFLEAVIRHPATRLRVVCSKEGKVIGFSTALRVCRETISLLELHPSHAPLVHAFWTPQEIDNLPATPDATDIYYLLHMAFSEVLPDATRQALMLDHVGLFALGGLYLVAVPVPATKAILEACGFTIIPGARNWTYGSRHPMDGYVLDLRHTGVERWIEAIMAGQQLIQVPQRGELERNLLDVLQNWKDDNCLANSPLMHLPVMQSETRDPTRLRETILRALLRAKSQAGSGQKDAYRALELAYLQKPMNAETAAKRLNVSRATFYRLTKRGIRGLVDALSRP